MATTAVDPIHRRGLARRWRWPRPAEGWTLLGLHALVLLAAAWAIQRADWADGLGLLPLIALGGGAMGCLLAKTAAADLAAHVGAFWLGVGLVVLQTAATYDSLGAGFRERLRALFARAEEWVRLTARGDQSDDLALFVVLMGVTTWLVAYMSAWILYRRRWLLAAILLPGFVILINLGYQPDTGTAPLVLYLLAACALAASHFAFRRRMEWRGFDIPSPDALPWRFLGVGVNLGLIVVVAAWTLPFGARNVAVDSAWDRLQGPWEAVQEEWLDLFPVFDGPGRDRTRSYAQFGDQFDLGGPLDLSDDPVVALATGQPSYLTAHSYDRYDGLGWESDVERTFDEEGPGGETYSPQMKFAADQSVGLSSRVTDGRQETGGTVTVLRQTGDLLFTVGTFVEADLPTDVQLSWQRLADARFPIDDPAAIPPDLDRIAGLVREATFGPPDANGEREIVDARVAEQVRRELAALADRFLEVGFEVGEGGARATALIVSGQLPVYDDVEAVFGRESSQVGQTYTVEGLASVATEGELREAGAAYPEYVRDRYLQLPTTITDRTRALAAQVTAEAGASNPFDTALAIQDFVRERITYREDIPFPPSDQDSVDYALFDGREGYCEYYASSMAVMLRTLGIPSRVVSGFFPAPFDTDAQTYVYRERNAHLWVEAYFPGYGWIPFEPTAAQDPLSYGRDPAEPSPAPSPTPESAETPEASPTAAPEPTVPPTLPPVPPTGGEDASLLDRPAGWVGVVGGGLLLALAVVGLVVTAVWLRGLGGLTPAGAIWARVLKAGRWLGVRGDPAMTPTEYAAELGRAVPAARGPARVAADRYTAERYGGRPGEVPVAGRAEWWRLRGVLLRSWPRRWRRG